MEKIFENWEWAAGLIAALFFIVVVIRVKNKSKSVNARDKSIAAGRDVKINRDDKNSKS